jgi:hypothetical protein
MENLIRVTSLTGSDPSLALSVVKSLPHKTVGVFTDEYFLEHFCRRIDTSGGAESCWPWTAGVNNKIKIGIFTGEYGVAWFRGVRHKSHRLSKMMFDSMPIEQSLSGLHSCDNPRCCNPKHIRWGAYLDNKRDCISRGRDLKEKGSQRYNAILTEDQVSEILAEAPLRKRGWGKAKAEKFGVGKTAISNIVTGYRWKHMRN